MLKGTVELENLTSDPASSVITGQMYFNSSTNKVRVYDGTSWVDAGSGSGGSSGSIPSSGLELHLEADNASSYSGSGTTWTDISGNNRHWNVSASGFVSSGIKHFDFSNGYRATYTGGGGGSSLTDVPAYANATIIAFSTVTISNNFQTMTRGAANDHQVIIKDNSDDLGAYDNDNATGNFYDSGYNITSVTNYNTKFNGLFFRRSTSSPYWAFSVNNDTSNRATITDSRTTYNNGFACIGNFHNFSATTYSTTNSQPWGKFHAFLYYSRQISFSEQADIYNYYKTALGI